MKRIVRAVVALLAAVLLAPLAQIAPAGAAPAAPTLTAPMNGASVGGNPTLTWTPSAGAVKFRVQVLNASNQVLWDAFTFLANATPPVDLPVNVPLSWKVQAADASDQWGPFSNQFTFTKQAIARPTLVNPPDASVLDFPSQPVVLSWQAVPGAKYYRVEIASDQAFTLNLITQDTFTTSFTLTDAQAIGGTYYWHVKAFSLNDNPSLFSDTRSYQTSWSLTPAPTFPPDTTNPTVEEVIFQWNPVPGAVAYDLQYSTDQNFANNVINVTVLSTRYSPPVTPLNSNYYWHVRARNVNNGLSQWSPAPGQPPRVFTRAWPGTIPPSQSPQPVMSSSTAVTLLTPPNGSFNQVRPVFTWTPVRLADHYEIQMSQDVNFSPNTIFSCQTNHTTWTPLEGCSGVPAPSVTEYWRVRPLDGPAGVNGIWSSTFSFAYVPNQVMRLSPANGTQSPLPVLRWSIPTDDIGHYRVFISGPATYDVETYNSVYVPQGLPPGDYQWRVGSIDNNGNWGPNYGWGTFTITAPTYAQTVTLSAPVVGDTYHVPALRWTPYQGTPGDPNTIADNYNVWYRQQGSPQPYQLLNFGAIQSPGYAHWAPNVSVGNYEYWVEARRGAVTVAQSPLGTFSISAPGNTALAVLTSPPNCPPQNACAAEPDTPTLTWNRVQMADHYIVDIASDPNFTNIIYEKRTRWTNHTPLISLQDNQAGQAWYWYARPCFDVNETNCGPGPGTPGPVTWAFRKQSAKVEPIFPANNATVNDQVTFVWKDYLYTQQHPVEAGMAASTQEARQYKVTVSTSPDFSQIIDIAVVDQTTYTPWDRTYPNATLYWKVQAIDGSQNELAASGTQTVVKTSPAITLTNPPSSPPVGNVPTFTWTPQPYAAQYHLQVFANPDQPLGSPVIDIVTKQAAYAPTILLKPGTYAWRVQRLDANGHPGPWTQLVTPTPPTPDPTNINNLNLFTLAGQIPNLTTPADGAYVPFDALQFQWQSVPGATQYVIETSLNNAFSPDIEYQTTVATSWTPLIKYADGQYYWRVLTLDGFGNVLAMSPTRVFNVGTPGGKFHPLTPYRALDSRTSTGGFGGPIGPGITKDLLVTDVTHIPLNAAGVVMNVTVTGGTAPSYLTVFPTGATNPGTASLLWGAGQTVPNLITAKIGTGGKVSFYNQLGNVDVIADVVGYYDNGLDAQGSLFNGITPQRMLDSRDPNGPWGKSPLGAGQNKNLQIAGIAPIPATATGVVMNVTATGGTAASYLTVYPTGAAQPTTANLLFAPGQTIPNLVVVGLGSGTGNAGKVTFYNQKGSVDVIADVVGYFDPNAGDRFHAITPVRALDSRNGTGLFGKWQAGQNRTLGVSGANGSGVPPQGTGIVSNVTVTGGTAASYLSLSPTPGPVPATTANLLFAANQTVPNAVYVKTGVNGGVDIFNQLGAVDVIMDIAGYFAPS